MLIYLDNCCFNRPYDDQSQIRISLETQAKLYIQEAIRQKRLKLASSYMLWYENSQNPFEIRRKAVAEFLRAYTAEYIGADQAAGARERAEQIMKTGVKPKDAQHLACAGLARCDCFLSTDDRLLKYQSEDIQMLNPVDFVRKWEGAGTP